MANDENPNSEKSHTVDERIKDALWQKLNENSPILHALGLMIEGPGPKVPRGSTKKIETRKAMEELLRMVFDYGLDRGYDMGAHVFGDE